MPSDPPYVPYGADFYKEHPKLCAPDDYWGQVKRTVAGQPVSEEQIQLIVDAVVAGLALGEDDVLLDLCCGNGALTTRIVDHCQRAVGVDFSAALIAVAERAFANPRQAYHLGEVLGWVRSQPSPDPQYTVGLCYGSFSYLPRRDAGALLGEVCDRFPHIRRVFIGNLPDRNRAADFFAGRASTPGEADRHDTQIGVWYTPDDFVRMGSAAGWDVEIRRMPDQFYGRAIRFDAVLRRSASVGPGPTV